MKAYGYCCLNARQIEAARRAIARCVKKEYMVKYDQGIS